MQVACRTVVGNLLQLHVSLKRCLQNMEVIGWCCLFENQIIAETMTNDPLLTIKILKRNSVNLRNQFPILDFLKLSFIDVDCIPLCSLCAYSACMSKLWASAGAVVFYRFYFFVVQRRVKTRRTKNGVREG